MKHLIFIILFTVAMTSCGPETPMDKRTFVIENDSGYAVIIRFSLNDIGDFDNEVTLSNGERFVGNELELENFSTDPNNSDPSTSLMADNAIIFFDNERTSESDVDLSRSDVIYSEPLNGNIFRFGNYQSVENDEFLYTITQEDYNNATPCDGPCE